mmetsp:Transcript_10306/g.26846  ORF Transcript_10306/g.26846 Transcript_10306/m.26846 type:complete len:290 (+) Transcript_10306:111-980(+)|eukprot:CAMPEP_0202346098 /NCGR_PEP_ID=MMETSP1126-20121109/5037_1 /ASSEMBLY_ACC=CAM_ASM_000457 /TAXON_ID=3047 /ORGANISM="Dunaliella tertiolecta, Strain CCMP1320" /LENGTH=289 /DNA_ID=CAMNT_0048937463 /DNA_START=76 /DNA_END=945 /DNA_ORIENTATION=-
MQAQEQIQLAQLEPESLERRWRLVHEKRPLIHCITNFVSMDLMANVLLAAGASPAMVHSLDEVEDFMKLASGLLINMGTLSSDWLASKKLAAKQAVALGKPWVLDPVACGATPVRTQACLDLLSCHPTVIRGNGSEIIALADAAGCVSTKEAAQQRACSGVDSTATSDDALSQAKLLAAQHKCIVAVSGKVDFVTDGTQVVAVHNGVPMLTLVTAAGCSVTALIAAFVAVAPHQALLATAHALAAFGVAAEASCGGAPAGPGSLRVGLLDELHKGLFSGACLGANLQLL